MNRKLHMILTVVVLLSACAWLPFGIMNTLVNPWLRVSCVLIGVLGLILLFERDMYLPFLADAAFPTSLLTPSKSANVGVGDVAVSIAQLPANTKVVYWAANSKDPRGISTSNWKVAYGDYQNAGVVMTNANGIASITIACPQSYVVSQMGLMDHEIPPHLHYRYELPGTKGMLSEVYTVPVVCVAKKITSA